MNRSDHSADRDKSNISTTFLWQIIAFWSGGLLLATLIGGAFLLFGLPYLLRPLFPRGRFMVYLFRLLPLLFISIWGGGIYLAYRKHRSTRITVSLILVSAVVLFTSPVWGYLLVLMLAGGWNVK